MFVLEHSILIGWLFNVNMFTVFDFGKFMVGLWYSVQVGTLLVSEINMQTEQWTIIPTSSTCDCVKQTYIILSAYNFNILLFCYFRAQIYLVARKRYNETKKKEGKKARSDLISYILDNFNIILKTVERHIQYLR